MARRIAAPTDPALIARLDRAYTCWRRRQDRNEHPRGEFDNAGRWYPSAEERCECCSEIREPSRAWPNSLNKHCRSVEHVASLHGVEASQLRGEIRRREPVARRPAEERHYFKLVGILDDGRLLSLYDGETEYRTGVTLEQEAVPDHGGGYYVYRTAREAESADVLVADSMCTAFRVVIRCRCEGKRVAYDHGKIAFSRLTPVEVLQGVGLMEVY